MVKDGELVNSIFLMVLSIMDLGKMMWPQVKEDLYIQMENSMKVNGKMIKKMEWGKIFKQMEINMKDNGMMINNRALV